MVLVVAGGRSVRAAGRMRRRASPGGAAGLEGAAVAGSDGRARRRSREGAVVGDSGVAEVRDVSLHRLVRTS